ncbi:MAG: hypothetical protein IJ618_02040 [Prevotella sp.]|jgi:hypothetical protein|nr:hypothetical protein [Prevotella sp.]
MEKSILESLESEATRAAINWAKTGLGEYTMERTVNDYIEATGANHAIGNDEAAIRYGRQAAALRINVCAIHALDKNQEQHLHEKLMSIAEDGVPRQRRGMHM